MWKKQWSSWVGYFYRWWSSRCWWCETCWMGCYFPVFSWKNWCHVWSCRHHRSSSFFSSARIHSNNTAGMTALWLLSFLCPHGPITRDGQSTVHYDSLHVAGVCLGTVQVRTTHGQLALACQQSLIHAQRRLRLTMQHVSGRSGNLGNECADHAAALGTFGFIIYNVVCAFHMNYIRVFLLFSTFSLWFLTSWKQMMDRLS